MDNDTPFGTFQPQPGPTFDEEKPVETPAASPKRKSTRSKPTPAAPSRRSSVPAAKAAPRRKYTRRTPVASPVHPDAARSPAYVAMALSAILELDAVNQNIIRQILGMKGADLVRLGETLIKLAKQ